MQLCPICRRMRNYLTLTYTSTGFSKLCNTCNYNQLKPQMLKMFSKPMLDTKPIKLVKTVKLKKPRK